LHQVLPSLLLLLLLLLLPSLLLLLLLLLSLPLLLLPPLTAPLWYCLQTMMGSYDGYAEQQSASGYHNDMVSVYGQPPAQQHQDQQHQDPDHQQPQQQQQQQQQHQFNLHTHTMRSASLAQPASAPLSPATFDAAAVSGFEEGIGMTSSGMELPSPISATTRSQSQVL
jgi:hypothetical protein